MLAAAFWHNPMSSILFGTIVPWVCGHMRASKKLVFMAFFFFEELWCSPLPGTLYLLLLPSVPASHLQEPVW